MPVGFSFPSVLVYCNLADTKRRTCHVGHRVVDGDIDEFHAIVTTQAGGVAGRVAGDIWLALVSSPEHFARAVTTLYERVQTMTVGWRGTAQRDGKEWVVAERVLATMTRSCRIIGAEVRCFDDIEETANKLAERYRDAVPGQYMAMRPDRVRDGWHWRCAEAHEVPLQYCPACSAREIEWLEGFGVYESSGTCRGCGAEVSFKDASEFLASA
jgi:hypothetical protein